MELTREDKLVSRLVSVIRDYSRHGNTSISSNDQFDRFVHIMVNVDVITPPPLLQKPSCSTSITTTVRDSNALSSGQELFIHQTSCRSDI